MSYSNIFHRLTNPVKRLFGSSDGNSVDYGHSSRSMGMGLMEQFCRGMKAVEDEREKQMLVLKVKDNGVVLIIGDFLYIA